MSLSVYANGMGFFHKGSNGKGIAPGDVCLTPPPPPAGPIPVPYVNVLSSSDLTKGSSTVKIDGEPTALEDASEIATSTGDEAGTQGGGVVTHKTKGKGSFSIWSFDVKVEGKGVGRHGDMMLQNHMSKPPNCVDSAAYNDFKVVKGVKYGTPCNVPYDRVAHRPKRAPEQDKKVNGKPCWQCAGDLKDLKHQLRKGARVQSHIDRLKARIRRQSKKGKNPTYMVHDHQPPLVIAWQMGGCHMQKSPDAFLAFFATKESVIPHCRDHANSQGSPAASYAYNNYPSP